MPSRLELERAGTFIQDAIALAPDHGLGLTLGAKAEHNDYTGWELQPSARLAWQQSPQATYWAAVSRAVRTPSRLDRDRYFPNASAGSPRFASEELLAWETGVRLQPGDGWSLTAAAFFHDYDKIRSTELAPPRAPLPRELRNGQEGRSYGIELTADCDVRDWWRLRASLTEMRVIVEPTRGSIDTSYGALESVDSNHYCSLRSTWDLPHGWELWANVRYASRITNPYANVPGYTELDARLAWRPRPGWELSLSAQNLLHDRHREYGDPTKHFQVGRSVYLEFQWSH